MLFISYAREDQQAAAKLINELDAEGIQFVIDPDLTEGDPFWREAVAQRFCECTLMVGLASLHAERSPWVQQERRAFTGSKLWVAIGPAANRLEACSDEASELVQPERALRAIRAALGAGFRNRSRRPEQRNRLIPRDDRLQRIQELQSHLDAFLKSRNPRSAPTLEVAGAIARSRNGPIELQLCAIHAETQGTAIFVGTEPVTNAQYRAFIDATCYKEPPTWRRSAFRSDDAPVTGVNWFEARAFAAWVGGSLPTEGEWLRAARGSDMVRRFATASGDIDPAMACYGRPFGSFAPVATTAYPPNPNGYYGLCGNTWDWCASTWGPHQVIRGGGCMDAAAFCTIETRYRQAPIDRDCCVGFRVKIATNKTA